MPTLVDDLGRFCDARMWQRQIASEGADEDDHQLCATLERYITEVRFRLDYIGYPYLDDIDRIAQLRRILRELGPAYDGFCERAAGMDVLPDSAQQFLDFLNRVSLDVFVTMKRIGQQIQSERKQD